MRRRLLLSMHVPILRLGRVRARVQFRAHADARGRIESNQRSQHHILGSHSRRIAGRRVTRIVEQRVRRGAVDDAIRFVCDAMRLVRAHELLQLVARVGEQIDRRYR